MTGECIYGAARDYGNNYAGGQEASDLCKLADVTYRGRCYEGIGTILGALNTFERSGAPPAPRPFPSATSATASRARPSSSPSRWPHSAASRRRGPRRRRPSGRRSRSSHAGRRAPRSRRRRLSRSRCRGRARIDPIVAVAGVDEVVALAAVDRVRAGQAADPVGPGGAVEVVVPQVPTTLQGSVSTPAKAWLFDPSVSTWSGRRPCPRVGRRRAGRRGGGGWRRSRRRRRRPGGRECRSDSRTGETSGSP